MDEARIRDSRGTIQGSCPNSLELKKDAIDNQMKIGVISNENKNQ
jgi:hypothetical protein